MQIRLETGQVNRATTRSNILPFCVRTGAPDVRVPATDKALATVDMIVSGGLRFVQGSIVWSKICVRLRRQKLGFVAIWISVQFTFLFEKDLTFDGFETQFLAQRKR